MKYFKLTLITLVLLAVWSCEQASEYQSYTRVEDSLYVVSNYDKIEVYITMRDGVRLFTSIYTPKDRSKSYPIILNRTPYSVAPYGTDRDKYRTSLGPSGLFARDGFIFVYQDVRGAWMSEGSFVNMTPHKPIKTSKNDTDESTDTWDTVDWLVKNFENNNGKVGQWGISYPGFYTSAGIIDTHPALVAASPQAPIADWWYDDFHHHGAFFLAHSFNFLANFGLERPEPTSTRGRRFSHGTNDGYAFFMDLGGLPNAKSRYFGDSIAFWDEMMDHPNYDEFWQARNILPHLKNINCAVLTVGGWFDAEDLYGPLKTYQTIENNNPNIFNALVMGPWAHGGWARGDGSSLGNVHFATKTSDFYNNEIIFPFFKKHLKGEGNSRLPVAYMFETGSNKWRKFDEWPPANTKIRGYYFRQKNELKPEAPKDNEYGMDEFTSDPSNPVPFTETRAIGMTKEYMTDDQRFASKRPDVLYFQTSPLEDDLTLAGPITANLYVSTTQSDADWIVKIIDVYPDTHPPYPHQPTLEIGGYQQMVRSEVIRGRFRNSHSNPEPAIPNEAHLVTLPLQDVLHTFKKGHRMMVQVQSTWFPLVDRNPQKYVENIYRASDSDFTSAVHRVYRSGVAPSHITIGVLDN